MEKIYCNKCGKRLDMWDIQNDFSINLELGYGSKYDGERVTINLCTDCIDNLIDSSVFSPLIAATKGDL